MKIDLQVIRRYLKGDEKRGDQDQVIEWFSNLKFNKEIREKYRLLWNELGENIDIEACDGSAILGSIYHKIKLDEFKESPGKRGLTRVLNIMARVAAVLFIPLAAYLWITIGNEYKVSEETAHSTIVCPPGTRTMFYLPDGSTGWLNGSSSLEFPARFQGKSREVVLKGEAFFDVTTNPRKPFHVSGPQISVLAFGTSFNVLAYPEDRMNEVTLASGSVKVAGIKNGKVQNVRLLEPDQMYTYDKQTSGTSVSLVNADQIISWKEGKLVIRNESFAGIVEKFNRWYNVEIIIMDEALRSYSYQATFMDETLEEVLKLIQLSAPIKYRDLGREKRADGTFKKRKIELYYNPYD